MVLTALHISFIAFIIIMGFWHGEWKNFTKAGHPENPSGFFPHGAQGVFHGASMVYVSYIGYDAVSTMAEEVRDPVKDIPVGVSGSVVIVTFLYCLMAASMSMLLPYDMVIILILIQIFIFIFIFWRRFYTIYFKINQRFFLKDYFEWVCDFLRLFWCSLTTVFYFIVNLFRMKRTEMCLKLVI